jgi:hypothetical protein
MWGGDLPSIRSDLLPKPGQEVWWEVWLRSAEDKEGILYAFQANAPRVDLKLASDVIRFPDRTVVLARGSREQMARSAELLNTVAELRFANHHGHGTEMAGLALFGDLVDLLPLEAVAASGQAHGLRDCA